MRAAEADDRESAREPERDFAAADLSGAAHDRSLQNIFTGLMLDAALDIDCRRLEKSQHLEALTQFHQLGAFQREGCFQRILLIKAQQDARHGRPAGNPLDCAGDVIAHGGLQSGRRHGHDLRIFLFGKFSKDRFAGLCKAHREFKEQLSGFR